jgi:hypothetical protein
MKKTPLMIASFAALTVCLVGTMLVRAQDRPSHQQFEYAMVKWDGPDKIQIFYPDRFENFRVFEKGNVLPKNAHDEEYCVNLVINNLAKEGWQAIQLHSTRVLLQRTVGR